MRDSGSRFSFGPGRSLTEEGELSVAIVKIRGGLGLGCGHLLRGRFMPVGEDLVTIISQSIYEAGDGQFILTDS